MIIKLPKQETFTMCRLLCLASTKAELWIFLC